MYFGIQLLLAFAAIVASSEIPQKVISPQHSAGNHAKLPPNCSRICNDALNIGRKFNEQAGIGFDLTLQYGTVSIQYPNGTFTDIAKVDGSWKYKKLMEYYRTGGDSPRCTYLVEEQLPLYTFKGLWQIIRYDICRLREPKLPASVISTLVEMTSALRDKVEIFLGGPLDSKERALVITIRNLLKIHYLHLQEVYASGPWNSIHHREWMSNMEPDRRINLCQQSCYEHPSTKEQRDYVEVLNATLAVEYTRAALSLTLIHRELEWRERAWVAKLSQWVKLKPPGWLQIERYSWPAQGGVGLGADAGEMYTRKGRENEYWEKVREQIEKRVTDPTFSRGFAEHTAPQYNRMDICGIILMGENAADEKFLKPLGYALGLSRKLKMENCKGERVSPLFEVARGNAAAGREAIRHDYQQCVQDVERTGCSC